VVFFSNLDLKSSPGHPQENPVPSPAALRQLGRRGVAELVERCCKHAHSIVTGVGRLPGAEMLWEPIINQGVVRFLDDKPGATDRDHDRKTDEVISAIAKKRRGVFQRERFSRTPSHARKRLQLAD
jgi:glutamate/tyrosine decarboxylase-like PLP-dependent enzyme